MEIDRLTPEAIALGLFSCAAFGFLSVAARVFPAVRIAIVAIYILLAAIGIPLAKAHGEEATLVLIAVPSLIGVIVGCL
jgi:hypothetical protein